MGLVIVSRAHILHLRLQRFVISMPTSMGNPLTQSLRHMKSLKILSLLRMPTEAPLLIQPSSLSTHRLTGTIDLLPDQNEEFIVIAARNQIKNDLRRLIQKNNQKVVINKPYLSDKTYVDPIKKDLYYGLKYR